MSSVAADCKGGNGLKLDKISFFFFKMLSQSLSKDPLEITSDLFALEAMLL